MRRAEVNVMTSKVLFAFGLAALAAAVVHAQGPAQPSNLQAPSDPRYAEVVAKCKTPPAGRAGGPAGTARGAQAGAAGQGRAGGTAQGGAAGQGRGAAAAPPAGPVEYKIAGIPDVVAPGAQWTLVWNTTGNNADGIIASEDGGLLLAQNDNGRVIKLDRKNQPTTVYSDTNTGGALAQSSKGAVFIASRGIGTAVLQLAPQRRVFANRYQGEPLECLGGVLNDVTADSRGGVYFTMGGLFYADPKGMVTAYGEGLQTNGVILSPDEKTLYVTNRQVVVAFDVRPDGSLTNQRDFAKLPAGGGDGLAVDAAGRLYVTAGGGGGGAPGIHVFSADGKALGTIAGPRNFITAAFAGPDKKTLYAVANDRRIVEVYSLPMLAQGYRGRAK
jgi:gluconolactonase